MKLYEITQQPNQFLTDPNEIEVWLDKMKIRNYNINSTGVVDVNDHAEIHQRKITSIPVQFGSVSGRFDCSSNNLTSLAGAPSSVGEVFLCTNNNLTSLVGAPSSVGGYFNCYNNNLISLAGAPSSVGGFFSCNYNNLTSLHNIHKIFKSIDGKFFCDDKIKSHILGLLLIKNLKSISGIANIESIVNKYLPLGDIHACQEELIQAGFPEYAKL